MKIVILDEYTVVQKDLSFDNMKEILGNKAELIRYDRTSKEDVITRIGDAEIVLENKVNMSKEVIDSCPNLKYIGELATGYDNVDVLYAQKKKIAVTNIPSYSTESVVQQTFSLILELTNNTGEYSKSVHEKEWVNSKDFTYIITPIFQLSGKSIGIVGYGNIGKRVAEVASAFGMTVNIYSRDRKACLESDIVTLHLPATSENKGFVNKEFIDKMKDGAYLINTARGALVNEEDLANAVKSGKLSGAAVDVIEKEPMRPDHPFLGIKNIIITPHIAWSSKQARQTIIEVSKTNLEAFLKGEKVNRVDE